MMVFTVLILMSCDSFWKHSYEKPVTISFKIPQELIQSVTAEASEALRSVQGGSNILSNIGSVDPTITARVSIHNAQDNAILTEKTIPLGDSLDDTVTFEGLYIVGKTVYVQMELSQLGYVVRIEKSNPLTVIEGLNKVELEFEDAEIATYHINYNLDGGTNFVGAPTTYTMVTPTILLGTPAKAGYLFDGWYANEKFEGDAITEIAQGSIGDITLYAKWTEMVSFYVSSSGDDTLGNGTSAKPFASVQKAVDTILEKNDGVSIYGIIISGTIITEGENVDGGINGVDDGMVEIESDTKLNIMLQGFSEDKQGTIDASSLTPRKRVLYINGDSTTVTLADNITITGGTYSDSAHNGGGVYIGNATFNMISETAKIENNSGKSGGGVYLDAGIFNLSAGTISGNERAEGDNFGGGGIYIAHGQGGKLNLSGNPIVTNNGITGDASGINDNVNFANDKNESSVKIAGDITSGASIGLSPNSKIGGFMLVQNTATHDFEASYFSMDDDTLLIQKVDKHLKISSSNAIYLSGSGNDTDSGTDIDNAVQSFDTALSRIGEGGTIWITDTVTVNNTQTWKKPEGWANSSKLTVKRYDNTTAPDKSGTSFPGNLINVTGGTLTVQNITIDGMGNVNELGGSVVATDALIKVNTGATLTLSSGTILQNNNNTFSGGITEQSGGAINISGGTVEFPQSTTAQIKSNQAKHGSAVCIASGTLTMHDGMIGGENANEKNIANSNAAVYVHSGIFTMSSGEIKNNETKENTGGGVYVYTDGEFTMSGDAKISKNSTEDNGGGISVRGGTFTMNGGTIDDNDAVNGGGIYIINGGIVTLGGIDASNENVVISNHTVIGNGGGIYVEDGTLTMDYASARIEDNSATSGGGVYFKTGTFYLSAGTITSNKRGATGAVGGGGIYIDHANNGQVLNLSGNPSVTGNTVGDTATEDNINFDNSFNHVKITGSLSGANIGLSPSVTTVGFMLVQNDSGHAFEKSYFTMDDGVTQREKVGNHLKISPLISMVSVAGGTFARDNDATGPGNEKSNITLSSYSMGETEITQWQWELVMGTWPSNEVPTARYGDGDLYPAYYISWHDAIKFCNTLSVKEGLEEVYYSDASFTTPVTADTVNEEVYAKWDADGYRLPTEAEWEYAAGGGDAATGSRTTYAGTSDVMELGNYAWYDDNADNTSHIVGTAGSVTQDAKTGNDNGLGLYDMSGNVFEWCWDVYGMNDSYDSGDQTDPRGATSGSRWVIRGGSWDNTNTYLDVAYRHYDFRTVRYPNLGFRVVRNAS